MAVLFPDIEKTLVAYFLSCPELDGVRVATIHSQPDETTPDKQLVITASYGAETTSKVTKDATVTLEAYADSYEDASTLGLTVEALVRGCVGEEIKYAEVRLGPVRTTEETQQERRSLDVAMIVKGTDL
jgi:hypothetical protein